MNKNEILYRPASDGDVNEIHKLMTSVHRSLENKEIFVCDDLKYIQSCICGGMGFGVVACNSQGDIIGSFVVYYPGMSDDNLGLDISLCADQLLKVAHMETAVVMPQYRGRGIQYSMLKYAEELIDKDRYKYCLATVSPDNPASCRTLEKNGYRHITTKNKYNGLIRRIYLKEI